MTTPKLKEFLDRVRRTYHEARFLPSDPLEFAHRYSDPWDQEAVALLAALLAYGNVKQIRRSLEELLARMTRSAGSPAAFVSNPDGKALRGFVHRFNRGEDVAILLRCLGRSWKEHGSLGGHFLRHHDPSHPDFSPALDSLISDWRAWAKAPRSSSFHYFLTAPADGSCCKRWCMFLRWMGRKDELDLGLWRAASPLAATFPEGRELRPDQLVIPIDTHTGRISQHLGLTRRKSLNWLAAVEVTSALREFDPRDPVSYDFALSRLGILDLWEAEQAGLKAGERR